MTSRRPVVIGWRSTSAGIPGRASIDEHGRLVGRLAEVELERGAAVPDRAAGVDPLLRVHVPERDVVQPRIVEGLRRDPVVVVHVRGALAARAHRAAHEQMPDEEVDRIVAKRGAQRAHDSGRARGVLLRVIGALLGHQVRGTDDPALRQEREERDARGLARRGLEREHTALVGPRQHSAGVETAGAREQRADRLEAAWVVVVAGDQDHVGAAVGEGEQRRVDDLLRFGRRRREVEEIAGHDHQVDALARRDRRDLRRAPRGARRRGCGL